MGALKITPDTSVKAGMTTQPGNKSSPLLDSFGSPTSRFNKSDTGPGSAWMGPAYGNLNNFQGSPLVSSLQDAIKGYQANPNLGTAYAAKDMSKTALPQYDAMRARLNQQFSQGQQQAQDSIDRQFAAMGGGPGNGAQLKQTENLAAETNKQKDLAMQQINAEEAQARTGLQQQEAEKEFQSQEALKGRGAQAAQFGIQQQGSLAQLDAIWKQAQAEAANNEFNKELESYKNQSHGFLGLF